MKPSRLSCVLALFALAGPATACRYNVREIGFVDAASPPFRLVVFVHGEEQADWLPEFNHTAGGVLTKSNITTEICDETQATNAPELPLRAQLGPRLPGAMLLAPGRANGWPVFLHFRGDELKRKLETLVISDARRQISAAVVESYGAVLLLRSTDESANQNAKTIAHSAITATKASLADLPKRIAEGPRLVEIDPSLPDEQVLAWSLGVDGKDLAAPVLAVVYGHGRLAGSPLQGANLTETKLLEQLSVVGADCECTMDHGWMTAGALPFRLEEKAEQSLRGHLGFDPGAPSVRAEISQILALQSQAAANPGAPKLGGYREVPLEIIATEPAAESPPVRPPDFPSRFSWPLVSALVIAITAAVAVWLKRRQENRRP